MELFSLFAIFSSYFAQFKAIVLFRGLIKVKAPDKEKFDDNYDFKMFCEILF